MCPGLLTQLVREAPVGICILALPSRRISAANAHFAAALGTDDASWLVGRDVSNADMPDALARLEPIWHEAQGGAEASVQDLALGAGVYQVRCVPLKGDDGGLCALLTILVDVTERKRSEEERAQLFERERKARERAEDAERRKGESAALLDTLLTSAPVGMAFLDRSLRYVQINPALAAMNGASVEAHIGKRIGEMTPALAPVVSPFLRQVLATGVPAINVEISGETPRAPSEQQYWLCSYYPVRTEDGQVVGLGIIVNEITERKRAEEQLLQRTSELEAVLNALPDFYFRLAPSGEILDCHAERMSDLYTTPEEFLGKRMQDVLPPELGQRFEGAIRQALQTHSLVGFEYPLAVRDGGKIFEARLMPLRNRQVVVIVRDITKRKRAEQELEAAHQRELSAIQERKRFHREMIRAVTKDKLHLVDPEEVPDDGRLVLDVSLDQPSHYPRLRHDLRDIAMDAGMTREQADDAVLAAAEAVTNAIKHAGGGRCTVRITPDRLAVRVSDCGQGIHPDDLPGAILLPGFSTQASLGMGYTIMLGVMDRVWLATGHEGTTVQVEKRFQPEETIESALAAAWGRL